MNSEARGHVFLTERWSKFCSHSHWLRKKGPESYLDIECSFWGYCNSLEEKEKHRTRTQCLEAFGVPYMQNPPICFKNNSEWLVTFLLDAESAKNAVEITVFSIYSWRKLLKYCQQMVTGVNSALHPNYNTVAQERKMKNHVQWE